MTTEKLGIGFLTEEEREAIEYCRDWSEVTHMSPTGHFYDLIRQHTLDMLLRRDRGLCPVGHVAHDEGERCPFCDPPKPDLAEQNSI